MRPMFKSLASAVCIASLAVSTATAANVHLKPPGSKPGFIDGGLILTASATLAGLGNQDLLIVLTAQANVVATCTNPAGQKQPPGQNPAPISVSGSEPVDASQIKNGTLSFTISTQPPDVYIAGAPGCPNTGWTEQITDLKFTSATLQVQQPAGTNVLTLSCSFSPATSNGTVNKGTYTCTAS